MLILDGREVSAVRRTALEKKVKDFESKSGVKPGLAVILVGEDPASQVYVKNKEKACEKVGLASFRFNMPADTKESELVAKIQELNSDPKVHGILVQLPLPKHLSEEIVLENISSDKDADGLGYLSLGYLFAGRKGVRPCTPHGVMKILEHYEIHPEGKKAVVIGRSNIVGKPMAMMLNEANATVTICHSRTPDVREYTRQADLVVVAAGKQGLLGRDDFKQGAVVVDVGMHRNSTPEGKSKLAGDVRFDELEGWVRAATPVPGGVGPMTITMLLENTLALAEMQHGFA